MGIQSIKTSFFPMKPPFSYGFPLFSRHAFLNWQTLCATPNHFLSTLEMWEAPLKGLNLLEQRDTTTTYPAWQTIGKWWFNGI